MSDSLSDVIRWQATKDTPELPVDPSPPSSSTGVSLTSALAWTSVGATIGYDVYLGTTSAPPKVATVQVPAYQPSGLISAKKYYWRITARNPKGSATGPVWSFTTAAAPPPQPPPLTIIAPGTVSAISNDGLPVAVALPAPSVGGGTAPVSITYSPPSGSLFPVGSTSVTATATDSAGQSVLCVFAVVVTQAAPPPPGTLTIAGVGDRSALSPDGSPVAVSWPTAVVSGGTPPIVISYSPSNGSTFPVGTTTVFITAVDSAGQSAVASFSVVVTQIVVPPPPPPPGGKTLLTLSDFTLLGAFMPPAEVGHFGAALASRRVAGSFRLYSLGGAGLGHAGHLIEYAPPSDASLKSAKPYPRAPATGMFGDIFQNVLARLSPDGNTNPPGYGLSGAGSGLTGLFWDEADQRMYWTTITAYNNEGRWSDVCLGYSTLNDVAKTGTGVGMWRLSPPRTNQTTYGNRWTHGMTTIPQEFADAYCGGRRLGIGGGGGQGVSITSNGPPSSGPTLFAIRPPSLALEADEAYMADPPRPILHYPWNEVPAAPRPTGMVYNDEIYNVSDNRTDWSGADGCRACWIDTGTKHGLLFACHLVAGCVRTKVQSVQSSTQTTLASSAGVFPGMLLRIASSRGGTYSSELVGVKSASGNMITHAAVAYPLTVGGDVLGGVWYYGGGPQWSGYWTPWYIYDPANLARSAAGAVKPWAVTPSQSANVALPGNSYPLTGEREQGFVYGIAFDSATKRLYVMHHASADPGVAWNDPLVYVYQVN